MLLFASVKESKQVIIADPSQRGLGFTHAQLFRDLSSVHQVSPNLLLFQIMHDPINDERDKEERKREVEIHGRATYWTTITTNGQVKMLPKQLANLISSDKFYQPAMSQLVDGGLTLLILRTCDKATLLKLDPKLTIDWRRDYKVDKSTRILCNSRGDVISVSFSKESDQIEYHAGVGDNLPRVTVGQLCVPSTEKDKDWGEDLVPDLVYMHDFLCISWPGAI